LLFLLQVYHRIYSDHEDLTSAKREGWGLREMLASTATKSLSRNADQFRT
jgi:hypothetical protein